VEGFNSGIKGLIIYYCFHGNIYIYSSDQITCNFLVCVCVKMQAGNKKKHSACTSKHFVSISKMSKVREAMTVLTTE